VGSICTSPHSSDSALNSLFPPANNRIQVPPGWDVPVNAIIVSFIVSCLLALINIGSTVALNNITSLSLVAILSSYIVSIGCLFLKRWHREALLPSKFTLGRTAGLALNGASLVFLVVVFVVSFFPSSPDPSPSLMNWTILIYGVVMIGALGHYWFRGRYVYDGPVEYVRKGV
jgi:choline transport protein